MPPVSENRKLGYTAKDAKSSDRVTDKTKKTNSISKPPLEITSHTNASGQPHKLAHDNNGTEFLETTKQPNEGKEVERIDYSDSRVSPRSDKYDQKSLTCKDNDAYFEKINKQELKTEKEAESELQHSEDEKAGGYLDNEATAAMDVPTELESAYVHKEDVQGVNKCSAEGDKTKANKTEDDSGDERDDHEDTADTTNQSVTSVPVYEPPQATQKRSHTSEEDSEVPIVEPTEYKMPPIDKAKFELTVVKAPFIQQLHELTDPTAVETKVSDSLLPNHGTSPLSLDALLNDKLLSDLQSEEQLIVWAVNQPPKHTVNTASRPDTADATAFLPVEKPQVGGSIYPYFTALAGPAGESPEELTSGTSEPQDCGDNDDDTTLEGSVSGHNSFWSDFSDTFDPHITH